MQKLLFILLAISLLGQASIRTAWTLHYQWNRATYIAACENKDKPMLHCDGKCGFRKQLMAREQSKTKVPQLPENFQQFKEISLFWEAYPALWLVSKMPEASTISFPTYLCIVPEAPVSDIFKPPA